MGSRIVTSTVCSVCCEIQGDTGYCPSTPTHIQELAGFSDITDSLTTSPWVK